MVDWNEIEKLQQAFQQTQLTTSAQKLSERNVIEIISKLQEMKLLDVLHTCDGKEYITPKHIVKEIKDELYVHGGRMNLVELQAVLNLDLTHVEGKCNEIAKSDKNIHLTYGQLISKTYLDHLAEEINENLQSSGQITLGYLSTAYDLPGEFLIPELTSRLGSIIQGQIDQQNRDVIYTDTFLQRETARIRGILSAVTRPTTVYPLVAKEGLSTNLLYTIITKLISEERLRGQLSGRSEKCVFHPHIYSYTQNKWVENFYKQNNYIEYDAVKRLGIDDGASYIKTRFSKDSTKSCLYLPTVCADKSWLHQIAAMVDEVISEKDWTDVMNLLPSSFTLDDGGKILSEVMKDKHKSSSAGVFSQTIVASRAFVDSCCKYFEPIIKDRSQKDAKKSSVFALTADERKEYFSSSAGESRSKRDEKKRANEKKHVSSEGSGSAGGTAREVKTKGKDKKRLKWMKEQEEAQQKSSSKSKADEPITFLNVDEITDILVDNVTDGTEEFLSEIAQKIQGNLTASYQEALKSVFVLKSQQQEKHEQQKLKNEPGGDTSVPSLSSRSQLKNRRLLQDNLSQLWNNLRHYIEATKQFDDVACGYLEKHLLKTICSDIVNNLIMLNVDDQAVTDLQSMEQINPQVRIKMISSIPESIKPVITKLNNTLTGKSCENFLLALTEATSAEHCGIMLKQFDKKKDRQLLHHHRVSLLKQLETETNHALSLHLAVTIIFQSVTGNMLNAPGKSIPTIILHMHKLMETETYGKLQSFQEMIAKYASIERSNRDDPALEDLNEQMDKLLPEIKEIAVTTKKKS